jgi:mannan endo-1,4-beta-mannosidase
MRTRLGRLLPALAAAAVLAPIALTTGATASTASPAHGHDPSAQFVVRKGSDLFLGGRPYRFVGSNNYYPMYKSHTMVDALLEKAADSDFQVMRLWGSADIGDPSGDVTDKADPGYTLRAPNEGVYMQYWDDAAGRPAYNDGATGLERMDYIVAKAKAEGVRLVIPFVNNWNDFGGMDQYVQWGGKQFHDDFYTDPTIRGWYKDWINHYLNRTNTITGVKYKDDPTIMMWELGNEPRCLSAGAKPRSENCTTDTVVAWADEMTTYIKSLDKKHLVGVGDEGFYNDPGSSDWLSSGADGVDSIALSSLPNVDVMSFHLYPDSWGKDADWATGFITRHVKDAKKIGKPSFLGEFGYKNKATRNAVYKTWLDAFLKAKGDGALYWILSDVQDDGTLYPDYDGFTVYCPSPVCTTIGNVGKQLRHVGQVFPPSADVDTAVTEFNQPATVAVLENDVTWAGRTLKKKSVDLDPATAGRQVSYTVAGGTFAVSDLGVVSFTPVADFVGQAKASYTVDDSSSKRSNVATITVTVKPDPAGALPIFTFEDGTQGWAEASFDARGASVTQTSDWASQGTSSGRFSSESQGWYTSSLQAPLDLTGKVSFKFDLHLNAAGTGPIIALQFGDSWTWCQASVSWTNGDPAGVTVPVDISLLNDLGCSAPDLTKLQAVNVFLHGGTFEIDNVRAE